MNYFHRIKQVQQLLGNFNADAFFCTNPLNVLYLTGFAGLSPSEREATLLITSSTAILYVPKMYQEQAEKLVSVKEKIILLKVDLERDGLMHLFKKDLQDRTRVLIESENLTLFEFDQIEEKSVHEFIAASHVVDGLRLYKDEDEKKIITEVVLKTDSVFDNIVKFLNTTDYTKLTELDIADIFRKIGRDFGLQEFAFEPIIASGAGSSEPHYKTGLKKLKMGEVLLMDFGFKYKGYNSDLTRTVCLGAPCDRVRNVYDIVLECNKKALAACKAGITTGTLQQLSVEFFKHHILDTFFLHGLGHGVGIAVHEEPYFRIGRTTKLEKGMVVTIEPGLYFANDFGIRIEDYVYMGERDGEVLSTSEKELITIK